MTYLEEWESWPMPLTNRHLPPEGWQKQAERQHNSHDLRLLFTALDEIIQRIGDIQANPKAGTLVPPGADPGDRDSLCIHTRVCGLNVCDSVCCNDYELKGE